MNIKSRSAGGFTLTELLIVLFVSSLLAVSIFFAFSASFASASKSVAASEFSLISDTINTKMQNLLSNSLFTGTVDGEPRFINDLYSGYEMTLRSDDGVIKAVIFEPSGEREELLIPMAAYSEFSLSDFTFSASEGFYTCSYTLSSPDFSDSVSIDIDYMNEYQKSQ